MGDIERVTPNLPVALSIKFAFLPLLSTKGLHPGPSLQTPASTLPPQVANTPFCLRGISPGGCTSGLLSPNWTRLHAFPQPVLARRCGSQNGPAESRKGPVLDLVFCFWGQGRIGWLHFKMPMEVTCPISLEIEPFQDPLLITNGSGSLPS